MHVEFVTKEELVQQNQEFILQIKKLLMESSKPTIEVLTSKEVKKILKISDGTLQNLRVKGILKTVKLEGTHYYSAAQIHKLFESLCS